MIKVTLAKQSVTGIAPVSTSYFENEDWYSAGKTVLSIVNRHSIEMDMVFTRMKNLSYNAPSTFEGDGYLLTIAKNYDRV